MRFIFYIVAIAAISLSSFLVNADEIVDGSVMNHDLFKAWMLENDKEYETIEQFLKKYETFAINHKIISELNRKYEDKTVFKLNKFADMSPTEFRKKVLMTPRSSKSFEKVSTRDKFLPSKGDDVVADLPTSFDWRDHGAVTPVKDQGSVGTCWAFSTIQNLEGQYMLKGNPLTNLSVEQVVDCDGTQDLSVHEADCGVYGGWPFLALQYVKHAGGIESEADYAYCAGLKKACYPCDAPGYNKTECGPPVPYCKLKDSCQAKLNATKFVKNLKVADWKRTSLNETDIAAQLMSIGPLSVALNAEMLQFYHSGVFDPWSCNPQNLDHAVLLVGWGTGKSIIHGQQDFWIVKNSWGPKWGEHGYFRILRNKGKCGINTQVVTAILE